MESGPLPVLGSQLLDRLCCCPVWTRGLWCCWGLYCLCHLSGWAQEHEMQPEGLWSRFRVGEPVGSAWWTSGCCFPFIRYVRLCAANVPFCRARASGGAAALTMHMFLQITTSMNTSCGEKVWLDSKCFALSSNILILLLSMKEKKELVDSLNVISTIANFWFCKITNFWSVVRHVIHCATGQHLKCQIFEWL